MSTIGWVVAGVIAATIAFSGVATGVSLAGNGGELGGNTLGAVIHAIPRFVSGVQESLDAGGAAN